MRISLFGPSGDTVCGELDAAGVDYIYRLFEPGPGQVRYAGYGNWLEVPDDATSRAAVAVALCKWVRAQAPRDVMIKPIARRTIHIRGMSVEEVERLVLSATNIDALDMQRRAEVPAVNQPIPMPTERTSFSTPASLLPIS